MNGQFVCMFVRYTVRNVRSCTANKQSDLEAPVFARVCMLTKYVRRQIFIKNLDVLGFHFQGQIFESSTLGSSYVIISQTVTDRINT